MGDSNKRLEELRAEKEQARAMEQMGGPSISNWNAMTSQNHLGGSSSGGGMWDQLYPSYATSYDAGVDPYQGSTFRGIDKYTGRISDRLVSIAKAVDASAKYNITDTATGDYIKETLGMYGIEMLDRKINDFMYKMSDARRRPDAVNAQQIHIGLGEANSKFNSELNIMNDIYEHEFGNSKEHFFVFTKDVRDEVMVPIRELAKIMKYFTAKRPSDGKACSEHNIGVGLLKEWIND
jgi:hypothetical protein